MNQSLAVNWDEEDELRSFRVGSGTLAPISDEIQRGSQKWQASTQGAWEVWHLMISPNLVFTKTPETTLITREHADLLAEPDFSDIRQSFTNVIVDKDPKWSSFVCIGDISPDARNRERVEDEIQHLFSSAEFFEFEDGMDSPFRQKLSKLLKENPETTIDSITSVLEESSSLVVGQALRVLGDLDSPETIDRRFDLLSLALSSDSPEIRDGALIGLVELGDQRAIQVISERRRGEPIESLNRYMARAIAVLENE